MKLTIFQEKQYDLYVNKTTNFKTSIIDVTFSTAYNEKHIGYLPFLLNMLLFSSKKYPNQYSIPKKREELYNVAFNYDINKNNNRIYFSISLNCINNQYTEKNNIENAISLLFELLNNPNIKKGSFDLKSLNIIKNRTIAKIKKIDENSDNIAYFNLMHILDSGSVYAKKIIGDIKLVNSITPQSLANYYYDLINEISCKIFAVTDLEPNYLNEYIKKIYQFKANPYIYSITKNLNISNKINDIYYEKSNFNQSKLLIPIQINDVNEFDKMTIGALFNNIFGSGMQSKLNTYLREQNSLCYSVNSTLQRSINVYMVAAGIKSNTEKKAISLVKKALKEMQKGLFTKEEIEENKKAIIFYYQMAHDSVSSTCGLIEDQYAFGFPDEKNLIEKLKNVTKEEIIQYANKLQIITNYVLEEEKNHETK